MVSILTQSEIDSIRLDIQDIIGDDVISTTITYKMSGATVSTWNPTTGIIPDMYTISSVASFKGSYLLDEIDKSGGLIEMGDVKFILDTSSVSGTLSVDDMIVESNSIYQSATTYQIKSINRDPLNICYFLQGRVC